MPRSFNTGAWTSEVAARMSQGLKPIVRHEVLSHLDSIGDYGATDQELEMHLKRPGNTLRPTRVELVKEGWVVDSGKWRLTVSLRPAKVWVVSWKKSRNVIE